MSTDHDAPAPGPQGPDDPTVPRSRGTGHHPRKSGRTPQRPALQGTEPITPDAADGHETLDVTRPRPATRRTGNDPAAPDTPVRASGRVRPTGRTSSDALPGNPTSDRRRARGKTGMSARTVHPAQTTLTHRPVRVAAAATPVSAVGFARYRMGSELGRGGLGLVQEAEDLLLRRDLAIKTLLRPDPASTAAFIEEAQITGQLEHPNIVPVHELGFDPQGRPYLAMKRVQGHTLRNEIARRHDSGQASEAEHHAGERRLLEVFIKVCDAVGYAHSRGVIHRDLKPDNVMVGEFGEVLVMDWGLARPTAAADDDSHAGDVKPATRRRVVSDRREAVADVTMEGDVFGTPAYMAPEQAAGHASEIGPAADIYALGAILYTILTGVAPFSGHAMVILDDVRNGKLVPPSQRGPAVPRELEAVTLRAMALDPADRYASAAELRDDIQRYMSGRALTAADYTSWQLLWKWARRHKVAVAGALSTAAAIIIGLAGIIVSRDQAREAELDKRRQEATQYAQTAHDTLATAQRVRFNRASPQDYYRAWLPLMLQLGQAIQTHPEPPQAWRDELAGYCRDVQQNATSIADWGMATHVAQSAGAWRALDSAATTQAVHEVELAREARIAEDVGRLRKVLDHIRELETGRPPDNGYHWHDPRRYAPSEFEERSMRLVARARQDPAPLTATVLGLLSADNASLDRVGLSAPPTWLQQAFLLDLLGRLRDPWTAFNGQTATDMATARLKQPYDPATNQETAGWAMAAAYLDCAADRPVSTQLGEPLVDVIRRRNDAHPSMAMAIAYFGINTLAAAQNDNMSEIKLSDASVTFTCDWLVSSARSGSDFTAALLDELDPPPGKPALSTGQEHIVIDLLGRWGDSQPPDVDRPERSAPALLGRVLHAIPEQQVIRDQPPGGRTLQARAVIVTNSLARLDAREYGAEVFSLMDKAGARSIYLRDCRQSARLFDFVPWDCDTPSRARTLALAEKMRGNFDSAVRVLTGSLQRWPDEWRTLDALAGVYRMIGKHDEAMQCARRAAETGPTHSEVWLGLALSLEDAGRYDEALDACNKAVELDPDESTAWINRGSLLQSHFNDFAAALRDYDTALRMSPYDAAAHYCRGALMLAAGRWDDAQISLERAFAIDQTHGDAAAALAQVYQRLDRPGDALRVTSVALRSDPTCANAWAQRAAVHRSVGRLGEALDDYRRAFEMDPRLTSALLNHGLMLLDAGDREAALADFERVLGIDQTSWRAWVAKARILATEGKRVVARACFDRALDCCPAEARNAVLQHRREMLGE